MKLLLQKDRATEYLTVAIIWTVIFLCGLVSVFIENDVVVLFATFGLVLSTLLLIKNVQPIFLFYALCAGTSFLPYINLQMFPLSGVYIVALLFVLLSVIYLASGDKEIIISPQLKWLVLFLGIGILYIGFSDYKRSSIIYCGQFLVYICVYWAAANIVDSKTKIVHSLKYVVGGTVVTLFISAVQYIISFGSLDNVIALLYDSIIGELFIGSKGLERFADSAYIILDRASNTGGLGGDVIFRVFGTFEGPTVFGTYLLIGGIIVTALHFVQINKKRVGFNKHTSAILMALITICLILTWTRSAILVFFMTFGFIILYRYEQQIKLLSAKNGKVFVFFIVIPLLLLILFTDVFSLRNIGGSTAGRLLTIFFALNYIVNNPIIGIGLGNYRYVQPGEQVDVTKASTATAHNTYLELGVEVGLPGLLVFLAILGSFINQATALIKAPRNTFYHTLGIVFTALWVGFILVSFFGGGLVHPRLMTLLWIIAGIQTASYYLYLNEKKKEHTIYRLQAAD